MADRAGGDDQVIALDLQLDPATGAGAYKGISSKAITAEGPPMPVEQTLTFSPSRVPV